MNIVKETKSIIDNANNVLNKKNKKYYRDVLDFLNLLFSCDANSLLKINIKKLAISREIFELYNEIIIKHNLDVQSFNVDLFFNEISIGDNDVYTTKDLLQICKALANNLLLRLDYKIDVLYYDGKSVIKVKHIN